GDGDTMHASGGDGRAGRSASEQGLDAFRHLANRADLLGRVIRDCDVEFVFERKQNIHTVHRINSQLFKRTVDGDFFARDALGVGDYRQYSLGQFVGHISWLTVSKRYPSRWSAGRSLRTASRVSLI